VPKITKLRLNLLKLCLKYCGLFFSRTRCSLTLTPSRLFVPKFWSWLLRLVHGHAQQVLCCYRKIFTTRCSAEHGYATVCRLSVCDVEVCFSHRFAGWIPFLQRVSIACYAERCISYRKSVRPSVSPSVCLSVCLSITRWHCVKMTQATIMGSSP